MTWLQYIVCSTAAWLGFALIIAPYVLRELRYIGEEAEWQ